MQNQNKQKIATSKASKIIFMGTPEIAVPTLDILNEHFAIQAVVTAPDKPKGRGLQVIFSPVKERALSLGLKILQPVKMNEVDFVEEIKKMAPDIIVVFAFRILPAEVYTLARIATFNIHTSLLPKYRGAAPINWAIINGETKTGLTSFILDEKVDTGSILLQQVVDISEFSTAGQLHNLLMENAPQFTLDSCELLLSSNYQLKNQDSNSATLAPKIFRQTARIDWTKDAVVVANFINGYSPIPCAWTFWGDVQLKIYYAKPIYDIVNDIIANNIPTSREQNHVAGTFFIEDRRLVVKCGNGFIEIFELQQEGKKRVLAKDFANGFRGEPTGIFH